MIVYRRMPGGTATDTIAESDYPKVPCMPYIRGSEYAYFMRQGRIGKRRKPGMWQEADGRIYFTCPWCCAVNASNDHPFGWRYAKGSSMADSVWCVKCARHLRLFYEAKNSKVWEDKPWEKK